MLFPDEPEPRRAKNDELGCSALTLAALVMGAWIAFSVVKAVWA